MKATLPLAALLTATLLAPAQAQKGPAGNCPDCGSKDLLIRQMQAEIAALKGDPSAAAPQAMASAPTPSDSTYTVQPGDGLMKIARKAQCKPAELAAINDLTLDALIHPGQVLKLPAGAASAPPTAHETTESQPARTYTIQEGDTYYSLARRMSVPLDALMAANPKAKATELYAGRVINLPAVADDADVAPLPASNATSGHAAQAPAQDAPGPGKIISVTIDEEISYGDFAGKYQSNVERLNSLNNLDLTSATILAKGSELYVPVPADPSVVATPAPGAQAPAADNSL